MMTSSRRTGDAGRRRGWPVAAATVLFAVAAMATSPVASASASAPVALANGPVVTMEEVVSGDDYNNPKEVTAYCHGGKKLIGVGFYASTDSAGGVIVDQAIPAVNRGVGLDDKVAVTAYETAAGVTSPWRLTARAICASGLSNVEVVSRPSAIDTVSPKTITADCPLGKRVVGSSFQGLNSPGEVIVTKVNPIAGGGAGGKDTVSVTAYPDDDGIAGNWGVTAFAFCATTPSGWEIKSNSLNQTGDSLFVGMDCGPGNVGLGSGWLFEDVSGVAAGNVLLYNMSVVLFPQFNNIYIAMSTGREDPDGTPATWKLTTKVVCATA